MSRSLTDPPVGPPVRFVAVSRSSTRRVKCSVCGATGLPNWWGGINPWMLPHLRGHRPCDYCGQMLTVLLDGSVRVHARCPDYPANHWRWMS